MQKYELIPRYDGRKSFYKKAYVIIDGDESKLMSYDTHVASIWSGITNMTDELRVYGTYSPTTLRHIKEFMQQFHFPLMTKGELEKHVIPCNISRHEAEKLMSN